MNERVDGINAVPIPFLHFLRDVFQSTLLGGLMSISLAPYLVLVHSLRINLVNSSRSIFLKTLPTHMKMEGSKTIWRKQAAFQEAERQQAAFCGKAPGGDTPKL